MSNAASSRLDARRHTNNSTRNCCVPSLRFHKASGQTYVVLSGKAIYCGKPDDPGAEQRYHQAIAEWPAAGRQLSAVDILATRAAVGQPLTAQITSVDIDGSGSTSGTDLLLIRFRLGRHLP